jgi:phosphate transport system substrate-binding protein
VYYRSVGSGEGIRRVTARSVDFAMTDVPLTQAELVQDDLMQFPLVVGAVAPVVNIPGVGPDALKLTGSLLADIYLGKITVWDAPALRAANPELTLPSLPIRVVHRSDGSGTSFVFTHYLSKVSSEWQDRLGIGSRLLWPAGVGVKGNEGVSQTVRDTTGAIGYVEYAYAVKQQIATVRLQNKAGRFVQASEAGVRSALASANWSRPSFYEMLTNRDGEDSWPLVGVSFALIHRQQEDRGDAEETLSFLQWIYGHGAPSANGLHYIALEDTALIERIESSWTEIRDDEGQIVWKGR